MQIIFKPKTYELLKNERNEITKLKETSLEKN